MGYCTISMRGHLDWKSSDIFQRLSSQHLDFGCPNFSVILSKNEMISNICSCLTYAVTKRGEVERLVNEARIILKQYR